MSGTGAGTAGREHLARSVRPVLDGSDEERIRFARGDHWIAYPQAERILERLNDLRTYPRSHRMPNLLLVGETNSGKSSIVRRFRSMHPCRLNDAGDGNVIPVVYVESPMFPDEQRLYNEILEAIHAPYKLNDRVDVKERNVLRLLRMLGVQMLVLDEIHNLLAGSTIKQHHFRNVIKSLGNRLEIPIVAVGTRAAFNAVQVDAQLANRFVPVELPRWDYGAEWNRLVLSFERLLPLRYPSDLARLHGKSLRAMTEGHLGELSNLLKDATVQAIRSGKERIDRQILDSVDWIQPSQRSFGRVRKS